jgi:hypothetical protein
VVKLLSHDIRVHNLAVHHVFVVLRDQRYHEVKKNYQQDDLRHEPQYEDKVHYGSVQSGLVLFRAQKIDGWSTNVSNSVLKCL